MNDTYDVVIIGAGAAGLFCAFNTARSGKKVLVIDHANKVGKKILMSGGGRCNFTNLNTTAEDFVSSNRHFCKSALSQYSAYDFLALVEKHKVEYVEKSAGQLFCKNSSKDILNVLLAECASAGVKIFKKCEVEKVEQTSENFVVTTTIDQYICEALVIATGGLSIPTMGASGFGYELAKQFNHQVMPTEAALVPFVLEENDLEKIKQLSGVSLAVEICIEGSKGKCISDDMLFTHRGLSGPAVLKLSIDWHENDYIRINLLPEQDIIGFIENQRSTHPDQLLSNCLSGILPRRLAIKICEDNMDNVKIRQLTKSQIEKLSNIVHTWRLQPSGTEGYRTAEVTLGGVSTDEISSKTMMSERVKNLYFIGEVLDVTGQLGGYNFQWAWSSAWCASESIKKN